MHLNPFSREDALALVNDLSLPVNSSLSSHVNLLSSSDPLRLSHLTSSSLFIQPSQHSVLAERRAPNPESSFSSNLNRVGHPELLFSMREPDPS
jgi:hypothetical protein